MDRREAGRYRKREKRKWEAGASAPGLPEWDEAARLEVAGSGHGVLLVGWQPIEVRAVEPVDVLGVIGVGPQRMDDAVGAGGDVRVVADEAATEHVARVD